MWPKLWALSPEEWWNGHRQRRPGRHRPEILWQMGTAKRAHPVYIGCKSGLHLHDPMGVDCIGTSHCYCNVSTLEPDYQSTHLACLPQVHELGSQKCYQHVYLKCMQTFMEARKKQAMLNDALETRKASMKLNYSSMSTCNSQRKTQHPLSLTTKVNTQHAYLNT